MLAVLGVLFLLGYYLWSAFWGVKPIEGLTPIMFSHARPEKKIDAKKIEVAAVSAVAFDEKSGARIFDQNGDAKRPIASLTKMMSALVFLDHNPGWNKVITIEKDDLQSGGHANFFSGDRVTVRDLFKAALIASDNSGITALARSSGLNEAAFAAAMNKKAAELHMSSTTFIEPTGLDSGNQATAVDISKLAAAAFARPEIYQALQMSRFEFSVSNKIL
jgi:D-alanyl-D-alanine endopeptidase (penicillin-binding protein 7)